MGNKAKNRNKKKAATTRSTLTREEKRKLENEYRSWKRKRDHNQKLQDTEQQRLEEIDQQIIRLGTQRKAIVEDAKKLPSIIRCNQYEMDKLGDKLYKSQERKTKLSKLEQLKSKIRKLQAEIRDGQADCQTCKGEGKVRRAISKSKRGDLSEIIDCANCSATGKVSL